MARKAPPKDTQQKVGAMVSQELLRLLDELFPPSKIIPGFDRDQVIWEAGQRNLIDYLRACRDHNTTPDEADS